MRCLDADVCITTFCLNLIILPDGQKNLHVGDEHVRSVTDKQTSLTLLAALYMGQNKVNPPVSC